jgi:hypothetical protein
MARGAGHVYRYLPRLFRADRNNVIGEEITGLGISGVISADLDMPVSKRQMELQLGVKFDFTPFTQFFAPFLMIVDPLGGYVMEQMGLFAGVPSGTLHTPALSQSDLDGADLCFLLEADISDEPTTMALGANIINDAISDLAGSGITRHAIPLLSKTSTKAVTWPTGTSRLKRLNDRFDMAGYYHLVIDRVGVPFTFPYRDFSAVAPDRLYTDAEGTKLRPVIRDTADYQMMCNRAIVIGSDPSNAPIYSVKENLDPLSGVSYANAGNLWFGRKEENSEIQDQTTADARAVDMLRDGASKFRRLEVETLPDPMVELRMTYGFDVSNPDGVVADGNWMCNGFQLGLSARRASMRHAVSRHEKFAVTTP